MIESQHEREEGRDGREKGERKREEKERREREKKKKKTKASWEIAARPPPETGNRPPKPLFLLGKRETRGRRKREKRREIEGLKKSACGAPSARERWVSFASPSLIGWQCSI